MSEATQKVKGVHHLPIFPLPLVMLPNELLPLHIFENRYRRMLNDVVEDRDLFGITLFEPQEEFVEKPAIGSVGCVAEIRDVDPLDDGRSNILTLGVIRYRLIDYVDSGEPYLVGNLEFFEDDEEDPVVLDPLADEVFGWFERMAKAAFMMGGSRGRFPEIAQTDPESLSFLITAAFNFDNEKKYDLIQMTSTIQRLAGLKEILTQAVRQMEDSAIIQAASHTNGHSKKKIDL